jgi:hypothetical protein
MGSANMAVSLTAPGAVRRERQLTVDLHLHDPRELLVVDAFDPFAPEATTRSGVEQIKAAVLAKKLPEEISVTIYLPAEKASPDTVPMLRAALTRHCDYYDHEAQANMSTLKREAIGNLKVGAVVLGVCFIVVVLLLPLLTSTNQVGALLGAALTGALVIVAWVVVWAPIETFFVDPLPLAWERRFYARLRDVDLIVCAEPEGGE